MKMNTITNWTKYFLGVLTLTGMLALTSCNTDNNERSEHHYESETEVDEERVVETDTSSVE